MSAAPLRVEQLRNCVKEDALAFETTAELEQVERILGQERAIGALKFGIRMRGPGYNIFALGPDGIGKFSAVREILLSEARGRPVPDDWVYVHDFDHPARPVALRLPHGQGARLCADMAQILEGMRTALPAAFRREDFEARQEEIEEEFQTRQQDAVNAIRGHAAAKHVMLVETPTGFAFAPLDEHNEVIPQARFQQLAKEEQARITHEIEDLQDELQRTLRQFPAWYREMHDKLKALRREIAEFAVGNLMDAVLERYAQLPEVHAYVERARRDIVEHADLFLPAKESLALEFLTAGEDPLDRYRVNLLVDHGASDAAPVVIEDLPNHGNLVGRAEYRSRMGTLVTDLSLLKAGALHRANGGFLLLDARRVLSAPYAWEALKRALRAAEIRIEPLERSLGLVSTVSLEPAPIPLDVKVVMTGDALLFYLLQTYDPDFSDLFKVAADFDERTPRDAAALQAFGRLIAAIAHEHHLQPFHRAAVAEVIEYASRRAEDAERLTTHLRSITDLLREADFWARDAGRNLTQREDVRRAVEQKIYRSERLRQRVYESIERGTQLVSTGGEHVGQVNGLSVIDLGEFSFGQPVRITATTRIGEGEVIDIERETELGGAIHSKGVLILSNFLAARFSRAVPLSLSASLVFEQSYGLIEGDSASLAELCALLSSLAQAPVRQSLAVTGSVNQFGEVQAIGGVNEKIEGFYDVCRKRGFAPGQGVVIPASNVKHLMLRQDVLDAARAGTFQVYAVAGVDEAIELLTGLPAGERDGDGRFPPDSVNGRVACCLEEFSRTRRAFMREEHEGADAG
jgi:lon-related putative ATP-dependent protease